MLGVRLGVVGILAREDVKVLTVYVDLSVICVGCVDCVICVIELTALFALAWRFEPTMVVVLLVLMLIFWQPDWRQLIGFAGLGVDALERQCQILSLR
ncbi:hypothetical protein BSPWISOXPB_1142 [uncultured Gammaproteobacteria bacterium]|nr:hypothetical protein BSPWISOXPB_1142 [uncultured Gammaproteobacteria bacterium]